MILRANRPPPTSRAPAPNANSEAALPPPVFGSSALAGAGAGAGAGGGGGAGAGGGGGGGLHGALATTPPALDSIIPSLQSASAFAPAGPPAMAVLALASATTCGSWARAGAANASAIASTAANNISFLNVTSLRSYLCMGGGPYKES